MHYQIMDENGYQGLLSFVDCTWSVEKLIQRCTGLRIYETGEVLKAPPPQFAWAVAPPHMRPIKAINRFRPQDTGQQPMEWVVGFEVPGGASVPSRRVIDALYHRVGIPSSTWHNQSPETPSGD